MLARIGSSLTIKLIMVTGGFMLLGVSSLSYVAISYQRAQMIEYAVDEADRLATTIKLGTHYAMMLNSRRDISQIIRNIAQQPNIVAIRIYNKEGQIKFGNREAELDQVTNIRAEACYVCHRAEPPQISLTLKERTRLFSDASGESRIGILTPIYNEPGCSKGCHVHDEKKNILGAIDVVLSMEGAEQEIRQFGQRLSYVTVGIFLFISTMIFLFMVRYVQRPIKKLIESTRLIARGEELPSSLAVNQTDEIGKLARAVAKMGTEIAEKQKELNRQRNEFQSLFANVPCIITVQDRNFRLLRYNKEFSDRFKPKLGDFCYHAYKNRSDKCPDCPVEVTFRTGESTSSEESSLDLDGNSRHWLVTTAALKNAAGEVTAAMEMCLDITARKQLESELRRSEKKYLAIFNNIPNPVFVLDEATLEIIDCNQSVSAVYGYMTAELVGRPFTDLFPEETRDKYARDMHRFPRLERVPHLAKDGRRLFVTILSSPSEYSQRKVLMVTTSDITKRLEAEQQLIHAGKMTTLGEMATGMAHELNQPLTVIKASSSYFLRKIRKGEAIAPENLADLAGEIDRHVDRAAKIINHLREFGRKPEMELHEARAEAILRRAYDLFSQQLKLREIEVAWDIEPDLPPVRTDAGRLEQVFVNLLVNARDAIEDKAAAQGRETRKKISLSAKHMGDFVAIRIQDTGVGVPKGVQERIFEPFFTTKPIGKGTGLGLSISYGILKDSDGDIQLEKTGPEGTTFRITLPTAGGGNGA